MPRLGTQSLVTQTKLHRYEPAWLAVANAPSRRGGLFEILFSRMGSFSAMLRRAVRRAIGNVTAGRS
jgi:hypothetical protein